MELQDFINPSRTIDGYLLEEIFGERFPGELSFAGIGDVHSHHRGGLLSFLSDVSWADSLNANADIAGVFCLGSHVDSLRQDIVKLVVDDPKYYFFMVMDYLARRFHTPFETEIGTGCEIATNSWVSPRSVRIGNNVTVEPGAYVAPGTMVGDGAVIRANATVGVDGFQHQRTSRGIVSPYHDGWLIVEHDVEIGYGASVSRGFSYRPTHLHSEVKMDAHSYIAHGTTIGEQTIICAHACVMGHVSIGRRAWLGPGSVITSRVFVGENARISLGSVVTTNVPDDVRFTGNFAVPHDRFIAELKARARPSE